MARSVARTRINRFELIHRFAIGGMGEIFLARERGVAGFDRQVVVKLLIPELAEQPDIVTLFIDEARIAANLAHPNIVQIFDFGRDNDAYFLAMEYVPGQNLARICSRAAKDPRQPFTRELAVHVVAEMVRGLDFAHRARDAEGNPLGIVHRDVSPHNLLLSIHGDVKVMDFGIAKASNALHRTATGVVRGKFGYMSPEQLAGEDVDVKTDVYASGVVLWELTLMRRLWPGDDLAVLDQARTGKIPRPREIDPAYPRDLEEIVMNAVARDPGQRTATAAALASDLRGWLALHGAVIERAALGNLVKDLFPEIDHEMPVRRDPAQEPETASLPDPTTTTTPALPAPLSPAASLAPASASAVAATPNTRTRRVVLALGVLAVAGVVAGVLSISRHEASSTPPISAAESAPTRADAPATADAAAPEVSISASPPVDAAPAPAVDAGIAVATSGHHRKATGKAHADKHTGSATPTAADAPPPLSETGWLVVESEPWGTFKLGDRAPLMTPHKLSLPPGDYPVTITFSESGATIRGNAKVIANATTKCKGTASGLSCVR